MRHSRWTSDASMLWCSSGVGVLGRTCKITCGALCACVPCCTFCPRGPVQVVSCLQQAVSFSALLQLLEYGRCSLAPGLFAVPFPSPPAIVQLVEMVVVVVVVPAIVPEFIVVVVLLVVVLLVELLFAFPVPSVFVSTTTCVPSAPVPVWLFATTNAEFSSFVMLM